MSFGFHSHSLTLSLLILSEGQQQHRATSGAMDHPAYEVIERAVLLAGYSDERKADLYARMAESVDYRQPLAVVQRVISECLHANDRAFPHG